MLSAQTIQSAVDRLILAARSPLRVILFGSYARGDAKDTSDLDLLVVEDEVPTIVEEYERLRAAIGSVLAAEQSIKVPISAAMLRRLNPYAVALRYESSDTVWMSEDDAAAVHTPRVGEQRDRRRRAISVSSGFAG